MPHKMQTYLTAGISAPARPLASGWPFVSLLILIPPLESLFQLLLASLRLLHWCDCCFLATTCVTCMPWPYLTGG